MSQPSISQYFTTLTKVFGFPIHYWGFPGGSEGKEAACNAGDGLILGVGRSCREGNGYVLQNSCLESSKDQDPCSLVSLCY